MYNLLLSSLPFMAHFVTAVQDPPHVQDKRDYLCYEVEASTIFMPTTIFVTISPQVTSELMLPASGAPNREFLSTSIAVQGSQTTIVLETPPQGVTQLPDSMSTPDSQPPKPTSASSEGVRWDNTTMTRNGTAATTVASQIRVPSGTGNVFKLASIPGLGRVARPTAPIRYNNNDQQSSSRNVVYFANWRIYEANYQPQDIPVDKITHILYAFGDMKDDGTVVSSDPYADVEKRYGGDSLTKRANNAYGVINQLFKLKQKKRNVKTLFSIGGITYSQQGKFSKFASSDQGRKKFASSAVQLLADWGMDGLDIDWEFPDNAAEAQHLTALLKETRAALDAYAARNNQKYRYQLTVATSAGPEHYGKLELKAMDRYVDAWHLMAYDYAGTWDKTTGHQANLNPGPSGTSTTKFNTDQAVHDYVRAGVARSKIILGLPLYGRSFGNTDGLGMPFTGAGKKARDGVILYRDLPQPGATVSFDEKVGAAWSYDGAARELVSYDNAASTKLKASYIQNRDLGGAVFWDASGDKKGDDSLVGIMAKSLGELDRSTNMLSYPQSRYDNIRNAA